MPTDQEYLATAGVSDENAQVSANPEQTVSHETPTAEGQAPTQAQIEYYELMNGSKLPGNTEFKLTHGGKILNVPVSKLANTYRQAEHMNDKWAQFKKQQEEFQSKYADADKHKEFYNKYGQLQTWSEQNPQEWERLWNLYQNKDQHLLRTGMSPQDMAQAQGPGANLDPLLNAFSEFKRQTEEKMTKYDQYVQAMEKQEQERVQTEDMNFIKDQVWGMQKEFPEINLDEKDPDGIALWAKVMQWGLENNYTDFDASARVFLKDRITDAISTRARAEAMKGFTSDKKAGIVQKSNAPILNKNQGQGAQFQYQKGKSYGELTEMAKELLGESA
jgi:hypothetical protein